jgi:hypothetical protein
MENYRKSSQRVFLYIWGRWDVKRKIREKSEISEKSLDKNIRAE